MTQASENYDRLDRSEIRLPPVVLRSGDAVSSSMRCPDRCSMRGETTMLTSNALSFLGTVTMATAAGILPVPSPLSAIPPPTTIPSADVQPS